MNVARVVGRTMSEPVRCVWPLILIAATLLALASPASGGREWSRPVDLYTLVRESDVVLVGSVARHDHWSGKTRRRSSVLHVSQVLFGMPAADSVRIQWDGTGYEGPDGSIATIHTVGVASVKDWGPDETLWLLYRGHDGLQIVTNGMFRFKDLDSDTIHTYIKSLDGAPMMAWRDLLDPTAVQEYRQRVLAVRNYLAGLRQ